MGTRRVLLAAGSNARGQLGIDSCDDAHTFTRCRFADARGELPDLTSTVAHIACGANHTVLLLEHLDGATTLWGTGDGRRGQLGPEHHRGRTPWTIFRKLGLELSTPFVSGGYTYKLIAAAWETTYVVLAHREGSDVLVSMGSNDFGALGVGEGPDGSGGGDGSGPPGAPRVVDFGAVFGGDLRLYIRSLHAGPRHVVAQLDMTSSGGPSSPPSPVLVGWGASRHGQLGQNGGVRHVARPTLLSINIAEDPMVSCGLGNQHTIVLHASGRVSALGSNKQGQIPSLGGGLEHLHLGGLGCTWNGTYMQATDGGRCVLLSTGNHAQGQLGRNDTTSANDATVNLAGDLSCFVCGSEHVLAAMSSTSQGGGVVVGWGWNEHGNMGLGSVGNISIPTQVWPKEDMERYNKYPQKVIGIWAGCATSWLLVE